MHRALKVIPTLVELLGGSECPYKEECPCQRGSRCEDGTSTASAQCLEYSMLKLEGCHKCRCSCTCHLILEIEGLASEYLWRGDIREPPVPTELISLCDLSRAVEIRFLPLREHHGCAWFLGDEWVIYLNANDLASMNRYTVFHEAFHIILHSSGIVFTRTSASGLALKETAADYFAASVLMPKKWVYKLWPNVQSVEMMATIFNVPESAMRKWVRRLGLVPME